MSSELELRPHIRGTSVYEVRLEGQLGTEWSEWFAGLRVTLENGDTILTGPLDQSGLHGVLRRVRDLGLPLVSVARIEPAPAEAGAIEPAPSASNPNPKEESTQ